MHLARRANAVQPCAKRKLNFFIIEFADVASYLCCGQATSETIMNARNSGAIAGLIAFLTLTTIGLSPSAAEAGPIVPHGHYCLSTDEGQTDCGFTSYQQCQATASGEAAECYGKTARDDAEDMPTLGWSAHSHAHY